MKYRYICVKCRRIVAVVSLFLAACGTEAAAANIGSLSLPDRIQAGQPLTLRTSGTGKAVLYIVGPGQVLRRDVRRGEILSFSAGELQNAGRYVVCVVGSGSVEKAQFDVLPAAQPASLSFLAKPSRLPANQTGGISGVAYVFDSFRNLIQEPAQVSFQLLNGTGAAQTQTVSTRNGVAWVKMNSGAKSGAAQFQARVGAITDSRIVQQVPGEPCNLRINAQKSGQRLVVETAPVQDCTGNAVSDGTIVTFTETRNGHNEATVDVPLKRGVARTELPVLDGAVVSVASGVAIGNEIRLGNLP